MRSRRPSPATVLALIALVVALGGNSQATVPDSGGMIRACVTVATGSLRIVDTEASPPQYCHTGEYLLSWNVEGRQGDEGDEGDRGRRGKEGQEGGEGPTGPTGPPGATGPTGPTGPAVIPFESSTANPAEPAKRGDKHAKKSDKRAKRGDKRENAAG